MRTTVHDPPIKHLENLVRGAGSREYTRSRPGSSMLEAPLWRKVLTFRSQGGKTMKDRRTLHIWLYAFLATIAALEIFALSVMGKEPDLRLVTGDRDRDVYVNTSTLVSPTPGKVSAWHKIVPSRDSALSTRIADMMRAAGKNPGRVEYIQALQEIDCPANRAVVLNVLFFDRQDRIVLSRPATKASNELIALADAGGAVRRTTCDLSGAYTVAGTHAAAGGGPEDL